MDAPECHSGESGKPFVENELSEDVGKKIRDRNPRFHHSSFRIHHFFDAPEPLPDSDFAHANGRNP
jgi:hypothetical protein